MKKLKLFALAFVIGTVGVFATTTAELPDVPVKQIGMQISELLTEPDFAVVEDMKVEIVLKVDSKDKDVLNYIRETLNHKKIDIPGENNRVFKLPLTINKK